MSEPTFDDGVLWAAARVVEWYDQPGMASELLREAGVNVTKVDEADLPFIIKAMTEGTGKENMASITRPINP